MMTLSSDGPIQISEFLEPCPGPLGLGLVINVVLQDSSTTERYLVRHCTVE